MKSMASFGLVVVFSTIISSQAIAADKDPRGKVLIAQYDYPPGYVTEVFRTEVPPNGVAPHHKHPGIESGYVLEGGGKLFIEGQSAIEMKPGMTKIVQPETVHWFENGNHKTVLVSTYVVEKNKPLMTVIKK
ncbi:hypothetical protein CYR55_07295 [Chimaeribacter californicus]|uniref:Cupin type-2 domain-containing protein n=1 Tax=Chimaeribacter californicus TaxID=2060067 RepID=A0A2N5EC12_9GAMM|nr:cupin domain-containing protein [Chimaeribacter californicus]PLR39668.1 hypothetical protein CYR55_07295 [Chimaeribacter californicus]